MITAGLLMLTTVLMAGEVEKLRGTPVDPDQAWESVNSQSPKDACTLVKGTDVPGPYFDSFMSGDAIVTLLDPGDCEANFNYPFQINSITLAFDQVSLNWPFTLDVVVFDKHPSANPCFGPGDELCRQTFVCDEATFQYPNFGTLVFDDPCCAVGPFFIGIEYTDPGEGLFPSLYFNQQVPADSCDNWYYRAEDAMWHEWYDVWPPPVFGYPIFSVEGETRSNICGCWADADVNNDGIVLSVADLVYLFRYLAGEDIEIPVPYKADLNGDCMIDFLDFEVYNDYFNYGLAAFNPYGGYPVLTCCEQDMTLGACCVGDTCKPLNPYNCDLFTGEYHGDGTWCDSSMCDSCYGQYPGDVNDDGDINVNDLVFFVDWWFASGPVPPNLSNADVNGDCCIDTTDLGYLERHLYQGGPAPVECTCLDPYICDCIPGNCNFDPPFNVGDAVYLIAYIFNGGPLPGPYRICSADANCDCTANVGDAVYMISWIFKGGPAPCNCCEWYESCGDLIK